MPDVRNHTLWRYRLHICRYFGDFLLISYVFYTIIELPDHKAMNYDVDLDATDGWTKCRLCKAVTCSMDEWKKHTVSVPLGDIDYIFVAILEISC